MSFPWDWKIFNTRQHFCINPWGLTSTLSMYSYNLYYGHSGTEVFNTVRAEWLQLSWLCQLPLLHWWLDGKMCFFLWQELNSVCFNRMAWSWLAWGLILYMQLNGKQKNLHLQKYSKQLLTMKWLWRYWCRFHDVFPSLTLCPINQVQGDKKKFLFHVKFLS